MKHEYRKHEKELYAPKQKPELLTVPKQKFICIKGAGNPNNQDFSERIGVLYSFAYAIRMMPRNGYTPEDYFEYTVYPLEGLWDLSEKGRKMTLLDKNELIYTLMIRQPDFVTEEIFEKAFEMTQKKKPHPLLEKVSFTEIEDGLSVQMLHIGSYDTEKKSFDQMKEFIQDKDLNIKTLVHREIYLSDARRVAPERLRTILRYQVEKI